MTTFYKTILTISAVFILNCENDESDRFTPSTDSDTDADSDSDGDSDGDGDGDGDKDVKGCSSMDIIFIVDNSGSMEEEQTNLANNFPKFIEVLNDYRTKDDYGLEYRVGVTSTAVNRAFRLKYPLVPVGMPTRITNSATGRLLGKNNCGLTEPWLEGPGEDVAETFSCMARLGIDGTGYEMPFAAMESALGDEDPFQSRPSGPNEGFYRKNSDTLLVVVMITDEDDCSVEEGGAIFVPFAASDQCDEQRSEKVYTPEGMKEFLDNLTGGPGRYVVIGIGGPNQCQSAFGDAIPAKRVKQLVELCGENGVFGNICEGDLWLNLEEALKVIKTACDDLGPVV
ncbi:MAG: VWA domain-containing protein [Proteobacteria bacterium]|nr:VWA domain-containing protein [Pseudomonadota bacterium]